MTTISRGGEGRTGPQGRPAPAAAVLADRLAAALVHHEPGWRLPRLTALARRYSVSSSEIDVAIDELAARHLVRRLPDGQVYRVSPAEYRIPLEGVFGLTSHADPMGGQLACRSRHATMRRPPEDIGRALGLAAGEPVLAVRCVWTVGGEPGALTASYLPEQTAVALGVLPAGKAGADDAVLGAQEQAGLIPPAPFPFPWRPAGPDAPQSGAVQLEMGLPPPSAARTLRMLAGEAVVTVTISLVEPKSGSPVALTMAMLRPELFRIVLQATPAHAPAGSAGGLASAWTHAGDGWEP